MISIEPIERKSKIRVEAGEKHEEGSDEVVDSSSPGVGRYRNTHQIDDSNNGTAQVRSQHHGSGVDRRQPGGQTVDGVLVDTVGHIEHDNADECEVEEGRGPRGRLDHGQHDGDDQDYDLYEHRPHNPWRQVITQSVEDIDPVEDDVGKLSTESEVLQEEWDEGGLHSGVGLPKFVMNKVLKTIPVISNI